MAETRRLEVRDCGRGEQGEIGLYPVESEYALALLDDGDHNDAERLALAWNLHDELVAALDSAPIIRIGEDMDSFRSRYSAWHREIKVPVVIKSRPQTLPE